MYQPDMPKKDRSNKYWEPRLKRERPDLYADLKAGKIASVRQTAIAAGMIKPSSRLKALKREWRRSSVRERREFMEWLKIGGSSAGLIPGHLPSLLGGDGKLTRTAVLLLQDEMNARGVTSGAVMQAMGYGKLDPKLGFALQRRWKVTPEMLRRLQDWLRSKK